MSIQQMMMVAAPLLNPVKLTNKLINDTRPDGDTISAFATYALGSDGLVRTSTSQTPTVTIPDEWSPGETGSNFECACTLISGTSPTGSASNGTWMSLGTQRAWTLTSTGSALSSILSISIRRAGTSTVLATAQVNLFASKGEIA